MTLSVLPKSTDCYFLQRWCEEWKAYVDIESTDQVIERDKLSVVHNPAFESNKTPKVSYLHVIMHCLSLPYQKELIRGETVKLHNAESVLSKVSKPSEAEATALATFFQLESLLKHSILELKVLLQ